MSAVETWSQQHGRCGVTGQAAEHHPAFCSLLPHSRMGERTGKKVEHMVEIKILAAVLITVSKCTCTQVMHSRIAHYPPADSPQFYSFFTRCHMAWNIPLDIVFQTNIFLISSQSRQRGSWLASATLWKKTSCRSLSKPWQRAGEKRVLQAEGRWGAAGGASHSRALMAAKGGCCIARRSYWQDKAGMKSTVPPFILILFWLLCFCLLFGFVFSTSASWGPAACAVIPVNHFF